MTKAGTSKSTLIHLLIKQRATILYLAHEYADNPPEWLESAAMVEAIMNEFQIQATTDVEKFLTGRFP